MAARWCELKSFYLTCGLKLYKTQNVKIFSRNVLLQKRYLHTGCALCKKIAAFTEKVTEQYRIPTEPGDKKDTSYPLPKTYSNQYVEAAWYDWWVKEGFFLPKPGSRPDQEKFVLCLPPPNVTGTLHLGHALTCSIQDALVRWHRMKGRETVWIPGCDHAGIATQVVVEKQLWREKKLSRHIIGRDAFLEAVWHWKNTKGDTIYKQLRQLGASLDWSRAAFTMDEEMSEAVNEAFVRLHDEGLIYRGSRMVNWSCNLNSAISDIEVDNLSLTEPTDLNMPGYDKPQKFGEMVYFDYPVVGTDERITVATTRLETMLGDTGVAVHPEDERYKHLHGKFVQHPFDDRHIPLVLDEFVDKNLGTGAVKITPSHDPNDYELGLRHNLASINVINDWGCMENVPDEFRGLKRFTTRKKVEKLLRQLNLFKYKKPHAMALPICSRSKDVIEPRIKSQWFVDCSELSEMALKCVESGELKFIPDYYKKVWFEFLKEGRSWCISRQIWWGHRIPAYRVKHKESPGQEEEEVWISGRNLEEAYSKGEKQLGTSRENFSLQQDEDVLDTWFSSALFPFSVNGWPKQTADMAYYPSSLLETGNDIIFFWVARMVMMGLKLTGQLPFKEVLLHGTLRDAAGRKMSKSLGNVIDPLSVMEGTSLKNLQQELDSSNLEPKEILVAKQNQKIAFPKGIPACGTDALRFALCSYNFKDMEINMNIQHVHSYRNFCNKIWQSFKYVVDKLPEDFQPIEDLQTLETLNRVDLWILSRLSHMVEQCDKSFNSYDLHFTTRALHDFWLADFCDVYLEYTKVSLQSPDPEVVQRTRQILHLCLDTYLRALSPFMPYLTEELFQRLPRVGSSLAPSVCVAPYPEPEQFQLQNKRLDSELTAIQEVRTGIMSVIQGYNLSVNSAEAFIKCDEETHEMLSHYTDIFSALTRIPSVTLVTSDQDIPKACYPKVINPQVQVYVQVQGRIDFDTEFKAIATRRKSLESKLEKSRRRVSKLNASNNAIPVELHKRIDKLQKELDLVMESKTMLNEMKRNKGDPKPWVKKHVEQNKEE